MGIILFMIIFGVVVISHELGHFLLAKAHGIKVVEFSVGMGPCLLKFTKGGTKYTLRLLPIGGACMFEGEDGKVTEGEEGGAADGESVKLSEKAENGADDYVAQTKLGKNGSTFPEASVSARFLTLVAGPGFNFILAFLMSLIIVGSIGVDLPVIAGISEGGAAEAAGLSEGDSIISLNGKKMHMYRNISLFSMLYEGGPVEVVYERDGEEYTTVLTPQYSEEDGRFYMGIVGMRGYTKVGVLDTIKYSFYEVGYWVDSTVKSLEMLVRGKVTKDDVAGPVGMAQTVNTIYTESKPDGVYYVWLNMLNFAVLLSANLGVLNLLPLPALDGGRIVFVLLEAVRGKPVPPEKEGFVHMIGFVALMLLMVFVFFNDLTRIF